MLTFDQLKVPANVLPEVSRMAASTDSPPEKRLLLARAAVPMKSIEVVITVAYLVNDSAEMVSSAAIETFKNMPLGVLAEALGRMETPEVLDVVAHNLPADRLELLEIIAQNHASSDETIAWIANNQEGAILDIIVGNKTRIARSAKLVESVYFNPSARMGLVLNMLEDAVRLGVDISNIPGWEEIVESIHGKSDKEEEAQKEPEPSPEKDEPESASKPEFDDESASEKDEQDEQEPASPESDSGVDDETFTKFLKNSSKNKDEKSEEGPLGGSMLNDLADMSVPQKVRLALLGSENVRRVLIRDTKRIVFMSVMRSPRLTDKEVMDFAKNKSLAEEIIRMIAMNREWTHNYAIKTALLTNPKTPPVVATGFLRLMQSKDVKMISRSHDIPGYIVRAAKQLLAARESGKRD